MNRISPLRRAVQQRNLMIGAILTLATLGMALVSLHWTPHSPLDLSPARRLAGPSAVYWLGTDHQGRDTLTLIMIGARNSVAVGLAAVAIGLGIGVPLGLSAATARGWWDEVAGRIVDVVFAFPAILSAMLVAAILGGGALTPVLAIGVFNIAVFARVARAAAIQVSGREYVRAAIALGRTRSDVALRHVLPNIAGPVVIQATIQFAIAILAEAALSYLGLGAQAPNQSWGRMLKDSQSLLFLAPTQPLAPGLAIAITVLGLNLLGDGLRDILDPKLRPLRAA